MPKDQSEIVVTLNDGKTVHCARQTTVGELLQAEDVTSDELPILGALVNNDVVSLTYPLEVDCELTPLTIADPHGWRIYRRSLAFVLAKSVADIYPGARFSIEHSLGSGLYCTFEMDGASEITEEQLAPIEQRLQEVVRANTPIKRHKISFSEAVERCKDQKQ